MTGSGADAVFYGGYYAEAGLLVKQLRQAGYKGLFMSGDGSEDPASSRSPVPQAADGAILTAPAGPAPADFNSKYKAVDRRPSGLYSTQAYDATNIFLAALEAGKTQRRGHQRVHRLPTPATASAVRSRSTSTATSRSR